MQVTAKNSIKHDGQLFKAGETLDVNEKQAADLLAAGVIEPVKGLKATQPDEAPDHSVDTPDDKKAETKGIEEVANLPVDRKMKKEKLIGIARAMGLEVEKTMTGPEVFDMIQEKRGATSTASNTKEEVTATGGAGSEPTTPANPSEDATAQNTTDTTKEPAPQVKGASKSK